MARSEKDSPYRHNARGDGDLPPMPSDKDMQKAAFGQRLRRALIAKGWNQSEMARQATRHSEIRVNRDDISNYVNGKNRPTPMKLAALAAALKVSADDLWPGASSAQAPTVSSIEMRQIPDEPATVILRINKKVLYNQALEVLAILRDGGKNH